MKSFPNLLALSAILTLAGQGVAQAQGIALNFDLDAPQPTSSNPGTQSSPDPAPDVDPIEVAADSVAPLPIPEHGANPPVSQSSGGTIAAGQQGGEDEIALAQSSSNAAAKMLPPPPPLPHAVIQVAAKPEAAPAPKRFVAEEVALSFGDKSDSHVIAQASGSEPLTVPADQASEVDETLPFDPFAGGTNSLVARIVGSAEGTRTPNGDRTAAYFGHQDPGNGVWNMGTFSYQHGAQTPEEADQKQLNRLKAQTQVLAEKAADKGIELSLEEKLNGIDLANQSPLAAIGRVGYIDRLAEARQMGLTGEAAIVHARTRSYINPDTNRWNAPGLGNTAEGVTRDQTRRMNAISQALEAYQQQHPDQLEPILEASANANPSSLTAPSDTKEPKSRPEADDVPLSLWNVDASSPAGSGENQQAAEPIAAEDAQAAIAPDLNQGAVPTSRVYEPVTQVAIPKPTATDMGSEAVSNGAPSASLAAPSHSPKEPELLPAFRADDSRERPSSSLNESLPEAPDPVDAVLMTDTLADPL